MRPVAIITGGSSGIGRATALRLAEDGFDVGFTYHRGQERATEVAREIERRGARAAMTDQDLSHPLEAARAIDALTERLGRLDAFVNNAGLNHRGRFLDISLKEWAEVLEVNLTGAFACAQVAARRLVAQGGGSIVNVTSILDREVLDGGAAYCASKAGLRQLTRVMALELAPYRIRVNGVAPGETATPMNFPSPVDARSIDRPVTPLKRPADAREIASAVAFLVSKAASYLTGEVLLVDGGLALHGGPQALQVAVGKPAPLEGKDSMSIYSAGTRP